MFSKESLYINAIKYDTQLKLDYKRLNESEIIKTDNSVFLIDDELLPKDIASKINSSQEEVDTYISTLLISDTTKLVKKELSSKLNDCEVAHLNDQYDIAVLKSTLFETKHYFEKTGIDFVYSAFHILNLHLEQNVCKNQLLTFLFNNKAFIILVDESGQIAQSKTVDLPTFESIKKTHFYEDDIAGQKLFDEIYYLELGEIISNTLNEFYEKSSDTFIEKITILYALKQLNKEQISALSEELLLEIDYHPINIDEEIFELSKDIHQKKSFIKPRKKKKKSNNSYLTIVLVLIFIALFFGVYKIYENIENSDDNNSTKTEFINKDAKLPDHININDKIENRVKAIFMTVPYDMLLKEFKLGKDDLEINATLLKDDSFIKTMKPELEELYDDVKLINNEKDKKSIFDATIKAKGAKELKDVPYKVNNEKYIVDEFMPILRVTEQLKIILPQDTILKFKSSNNDDITRFNYFVNIQVKHPNEFFELLNTLNNELYSIHINYPIKFVKLEDSLEVDFNLVFNQPK